MNKILKNSVILVILFLTNSYLVCADDEQESFTKLTEKLKEIELDKRFQKESNYWHLREKQISKKPSTLDVKVLDDKASESLKGTPSTNSVEVAAPDILTKNDENIYIGSIPFSMPGIFKVFSFYGLGKELDLESKKNQWSINTFSSYQDIEAIDKNVAYKSEGWTSEINLSWSKIFEYGILRADISAIYHGEDMVAYDIAESKSLFPQESSDLGLSDLRLSYQTNPSKKNFPSFHVFLTVPTGDKNKIHGNGRISKGLALSIHKQRWQGMVGLVDYDRISLNSVDYDLEIGYFAQISIRKENLYKEWSAESSIYISSNPIREHIEGDGINDVLSVLSFSLSKQCSGYKLKPSLSIGYPKYISPGFSIKF